MARKSKEVKRPVESLTGVGLALAGALSLIACAAAPQNRDVTTVGTPTALAERSRLVGLLRPAERSRRP